MTSGPSSRPTTSWDRCDGDAVKCPLCLDTTLEVTHHGGIEVDICPRCRGVWLDRGELERLVAGPAPRADRLPPPAGTPPVPPPTDPRGPAPSDRDGDARRSKKDRKRRFSDRLGDVFEEILDL